MNVYRIILKGRDGTYFFVNACFLSLDEANSFLTKREYYTNKTGHDYEPRLVMQEMVFFDVRS